MNLDDEPRDQHSPSCLIWASPDPADRCDCGTDDLSAALNGLYGVFEQRAQQVGERAS